VTCSSHERQQVPTDKTGELELPVLVIGEPDDREGALFSVVDSTGSVEITGTYDSIIKFASDLIVKMYSWPVISGHVDWLSPETVAAVLEGEIPHGNAGD
jgi:hypothetical protein